MSILVKMMSMNTQTEQAKGKKLISLEGNSLLENTTDISTMEQAKGKKLISLEGNSLLENTTDISTMPYSIKLISTADNIKLDKKASIMSSLNNKIDLELEQSIIGKNKSIMSELNPIEKKIEVVLSKPAMSKNEADKMSNRLTQLKEHLRKMDIMRNKGINIDPDQRTDIVAEITKIEQKLAENTPKNTEKDTECYKIESKIALPIMSINTGAISNITMSVINFGNFAVGDKVGFSFKNKKEMRREGGDGKITKITDKLIWID
jgi:hypothetical protein